MRKQLLLKEASKMLKKRTLTTLGLKNKLRKKYNEYNWTQKFVSECMLEIWNNRDIEGLDYFDNGKYREYSIKSNVEFVPQSKLIQKLIDINKKGRFAGVSWKAGSQKNGSLDRTYNGRILGDSPTMRGYWLFKTKNGKIKQVDPRTLYRVSGNKKIFIIK